MTLLSECSSGWVYTLKPLDREHMDSFTLQVTVSDGKYVSIKTVAPKLLLQVTPYKAYKGQMREQKCRKRQILI